VSAGAVLNSGAGRCAMHDTAQQSPHLAVAAVRGSSPTMSDGCMTCASEVPRGRCSGRPRRRPQESAGAPDRGVDRGLR
jgi:hypothetical protein